MRVLHVSTFDTYGAARAMLRWHSGLNEAGVESRVLCFRRSVDTSDIYHPLCLRIALRQSNREQLRNVGLTNVEPASRIIFSVSPFTRIRLSERNS